MPRGPRDDQRERHRSVADCRDRRGRAELVRRCPRRGGGSPLPDADLDGHPERGNLPGDRKPADGGKNFRAVRQPGPAGIHMAENPLVPAVQAGGLPEDGENPPVQQLYRVPDDRRGDAGSVPGVRAGLLRHAEGMLGRPGVRGTRHSAQPAAGDCSVPSDCRETDPGSRGTDRTESRNAGRCRRAGRGVRNPRRRGGFTRPDTGAGRPGRRNEHLYRPVRRGSAADPRISCGAGTLAAPGRHHRRRRRAEMASGNDVPGTEL